MSGCVGKAEGFAQPCRTVCGGRFAFGVSTKNDWKVDDEVDTARAVSENGELSVSL